MTIELEKIKQYYYNNTVVFEPKYLEMFKKYLT